MIPGYVTASDVARILDWQKDRVIDWIQAGKIHGVVKHGRYTLVPIKEVERLRLEVDNRPDEAILASMGRSHWVRAQKVRKELGYSDTHMWRLLRTGVIPSWKSPNTNIYYVDADEARSIRKAMVEGRGEWPTTPAMAEERRRAREYGKSIRNPKRAEETKRLRESPDFVPPRIGRTPAQHEPGSKAWLKQRYYMARNRRAKEVCPLVREQLTSEMSELSRAWRQNPEN